MYKVNDYVVYKKDVCKVKEIKKNSLNGKDSYVLIPMDDASLTIEVPVDHCLGYLREVLSKEEADSLIRQIGYIKPLENMDEKYLERTYRELLYHGTLEDLIKVIKTAYLRNDDRVKNNKKVSEKDSEYFERAEKYLYNELSIVYHMSFEETRNYVIHQVQEFVK